MIAFFEMTVKKCINNHLPHEDFQSIFSGLLFLPVQPRYLAQFSVFSLSGFDLSFIPVRNSIVPLVRNAVTGATIKLAIRGGKLLT